MVEKVLQEKIQRYEALSKMRKQYIEAVSVMSWDLQTYAPKGAVEERSETMGMLATEAFKISVSEEFETLLADLMKKENFSQLSRILQRAVEEDKKELDRFKKLPPEKYQAYQVLTAKAQSVWEEAREKHDFSLFQPYLEEIVKFQQEFVQLVGYEQHPYNALLDQYEPDMTVEILDGIFEYIKEKTIPLLKKIKESKVIMNTSIFNHHYDIEKQKVLSLEILREMGYDFNQGRLDESAHPFTSKLNTGDVRLTTHYDPDFLSNAFYSAVHEGGHGLYEQNVSRELKDTCLAGGTSMGIHESQSRYWENMLARSFSFWTYYEPKIRAAFPKEFEGISLEEIYKAINQVAPSLIRIQADELTYNLHIIVRYELEKALVEGKIQVADLPSLWNEKMEAYLGVKPKHDGEGVLQDVHWSGGMFGYFPSYSLGNIYAAQFCVKMKEQIPNYDKVIEEGNFKVILDWLKENIHQHGGMLKPIPLMEKITGEGINPEYYAAYLEEKYNQVYELV